ncbi:MAG: carbamoyltransferase HypF [Desulfurococcales archaeon]|nr:carbamoyltransferase HypF [Desulfurococcales archaeon]
MRAVRVVVEGIVQGVGFRPYVHRLAVKVGVKGYVRNVGGSEVEIWVEGDGDRVEEFIKLLPEERPPPALIESMQVFEVRPKGFNDFKILPSGKERIRRSMIPPDFAICEHCLREVLDPKDRRYRYAFNSCAWCGPRYSMMLRAPYDRENTAMRKYKLCSECLKEYRDLRNVRRYHAQGISCPKDGPKLYLMTSEGEHLDTRDPIEEAAKLIDEGYLVAVKGLGGFHIAALATDDEVIQKLRERKSRPTKPFAVMGLNIETLSKLVVINSTAEKLLKSPERPIVLLPKKDGSPASPLVSPGMDVEGIFTPYTALHYLLLQSTKDKFLIMTSGNPKGLPMCVNDECVTRYLRNVIDYVLSHDREIVNRVDDSVVRFTRNSPVLLRRGRGYAPRWIKINKELGQEVIALGADLQSAGAVGFEDKVVLTQYIGDLDNPETISELDKYLKFFIENYGIDPGKSVIVVDKHPLYFSRRLGLEYAEKWGVTLLEVQHHYAHALSAAADTGILGEDFAAVVVDGVGYGDDGAIWGGELLQVDSDLRYRRLGHLKYLPIIGDASVERPARFLATALIMALKDEEEAWNIMRSWGADKGLKGGRLEFDALASQLRRGNYVPTSSTGRVLDAFSALLGVRMERTFEGEPAIALEAYSRRGTLVDDIAYSFKASLEGSECVVDTLTPLKQAVFSEDLRKEDIAASIQYGVGYGLGLCLKRYLAGTGIKHVVLSGGAAVNDWIVKGLEDALKEIALSAILPSRVPPNDGGIALGQVAYVIGWGKDLY